MKKIALGQTITILANLGVIAGIAFLAVELQQNNELLAAQARSDLTDRAARYLEITMTSPDLSEILTREAAGEPLTTAEEFRLNQAARRLLWSIEAQFVEVEHGVVTLETLPVRQWRALFHGTTGTDFGVRAQWEQVYRHGTSPSFAEFVEQQIIEPGPP